MRPVASERLNRRKFIKTTSGTSATLLAGCIGSEGDGNGDGSGDDVGTLQVSDYLPEQYIIRQETIAPWAEQVNEKLEVPVDFEFFPAGQLGAEDEQLDLLKSGTADIASTFPTNLPDRMPLSTLDSLPGLPGDLVDLSNAIWELARNELTEKEYDDLDIEPLVGGALVPNEILTVDEQLETPSDMEGMTVRSGGGLLDTTLETLGATPTHLQIVETADALKQGTVDAVLINTVSVKPFGLHEPGTHITTNLNLGASWVPYFISQSTLDSLPDSVRTTFRDVGDGMSGDIGRGYQESEQNSLDDLADEGVESYEVSNYDNEWLPKLEEVHDIWIGDDSGRQEVYDAYIGYLEEEV